MRALLVIDVQHDFLPGGALAVPQGDQVVAPIVALRGRYPVVVATQDWHPADHLSFAAMHPGRSPGEVIDLFGLRQVLWPTHCVQGTRGAELVSALEPRGFHAIFRKGTDRNVDSYSGFWDNGKRGDTGLGAWLGAQGVDAVDVVGLATDYCVKFSTLDALALGLEARVIHDACRAVDLSPGDGERALAELVQAGATLVHSDDVR